MERGSEGIEGLGLAMRERTWTEAVTDVWRSALRHKVLSSIVAVCLVASLGAIAWAGTRTSKTVRPTGASSQPAPAFSLPVLGQARQQVALRDYVGKPLIVNFFASWCDICRTETPLLARFYRAEHAKVAVIGLDENDAAAHAISFTKTHGVTFPIGFDPELTASYAYGVTALPQTFFLDARHRVVDRVIGTLTTADLTRGLALAAG